MGLLDCASGASVWRGYDCFRKNKVTNMKESGDGIFSADVAGTADMIYIIPGNRPAIAHTQAANALSASIWWQHIFSMSGRG